MSIGAGMESIWSLGKAFQELKQIVLELLLVKAKSASISPMERASFGWCLPVFSLHLLSALLPDLPEISVSHVNLTVREGDNAVITCNGSGSPLPDVDWIVTGLQSINTHQVGILASAPIRVLRSSHLSVIKRESLWFCHYRKKHVDLDSNLMKYFLAILT